MTNRIKANEGNYFILLSLLCSMSFLCAYGQSLHEVTLDLNVGGEVYDVTYDGTKDVYVVVGDFTSIQGQARKKSFSRKNVHS